MCVLGKFINKRMLRMKLHYFLYLGSIASIVGFLPTIAKQLGYSPIIVGSLYTFLSFISFLVRPICGIIVDKFPVKRYLFLACVLVSGFSAFALNYIEKLPSEAVGILRCDQTTTLNVCSNNDDQLSKCDDSLSKLLTNSVQNFTCQITETVASKNTFSDIYKLMANLNIIVYFIWIVLMGMCTAMLSCQQNESFWEETCKSWNINNCTTANFTYNNNDFDYRLNVSLFMNVTDQVKENTELIIKSVQYKDQQVLQPVCQKPVNTLCKIDCSNEVIMGLATVPKFEGSIFGSYPFWELFVTMSLFWISQAVTWSLQDVICFDLLGDKIEDFGKSRCWGSISWGIFSIFGGALIDYFSVGDLLKNYIPIYYLCLTIILCDFAIAYKIKITETVASKNTFSDIYKLMANLNIIVYFIWIVLMGMCTAMVWDYLFWYMEDITLKYQRDKQSWIKTLQGFAIGIQCIGGELPFLFFSGSIIKRIGHCHCMSLGLLVFAVRFYLYSIITDPVWILPVEFTNGITFGLTHATLMGYARVIAPDSATTTIVGFAGALFEGVGISLGGLLGGVLYEKYGGAWTFQLFSYGSLTMCVLHIVFNKFFKSNERTSSLDTDLQEDVSVDGKNKSG